MCRETELKENLDDQPMSHHFGVRVEKRILRRKKQGRNWRNIIPRTLKDLQVSCVLVGERGKGPCSTHSDRTS